MKFPFPLAIIGLLSSAMASAGCSQWQGVAGKFKGPGSSVAESGPAPGTAANADPGGSSSGVETVKGPLPLARVSEHRGQYDQAERLYREVIRRSPNDPVAHHRLGVMNAKRGKFVDAQRSFERAMALKSDDPELLSDIGYFCYLANRPEDAERYLRQALAINPETVAACNNLAIVLGEQGRYDEALALFRRAGNEDQACANLAFVLAQRGDYQKAMELYNQVLTRDPKSRLAADALVQLAKLTDAQRSGTPAQAVLAGQSAAPRSSQLPAVYQEVSTSPGRALPVSYNAAANVTPQGILHGFGPQQARFQAQAVSGDYQRQGSNLPMHAEGAAVSPANALVGTGGPSTQSATIHWRETPDDAYASTRDSRPLPTALRSPAPTVGDSGL